MYHIAEVILGAISSQGVEASLVAITQSWRDGSVEPSARELPQQARHEAEAPSRDVTTSNPARVWWWARPRERLVPPAA
jgi:hypothetical protein